MVKLLTKRIQYFGLFAILLLLITGPMYYFMNRYLYLEAVDEELLEQILELNEDKLAFLSQEEISIRNQVSEDILILPDTVRHSFNTPVTLRVFETWEQEWSNYRFIFHPIQVNGQRMVYSHRIDQLEQLDFAKSFILIYIPFYTFFVIGLMLFNRFASARIWKPFFKSLASLKAFNIETDTSLNLYESDIVEFNELNRTLESTASASIQAYRSQREFTENASHDLQTPLAILNSKFDLVLQSENLSQEFSEILEQCYLAVGRLTRINKNLLLLSHFGSGRNYEKVELRLDVMMMNTLDFFEDFVSEKGLSIVRNQFPQTDLQGNKYLTEILLSNLLLNAIKHNVQDGIIEVNIDQKRLRIANTCIGQPLDPQTIFDRYSSSSADRNNSGLGLAIVKKICVLQGWEVEYSHLSGMHVFSVSFI